MLSDASESTERETRGRMRHPASTLADFHKSLLNVVLENCLPTSMSHGEKGKFFKTVAEIIGCSGKHAQKVYEDLVQSHKRNELRSLYKSGVQEEPLSEIGSLIQDCIALTEVAHTENERFEVHRSAFQPRLHTGKMALERSRPSTAFEDLTSSVISESPPARSISRPGRRNSRDQDFDFFKRFIEEFVKHNHLMEEIVRQSNPVPDENEHPERL